MGYYPAMRMVHILKCDDIDDFYKFRLALFNSPDWKELWEDGDIFGVKFGHTSLDVHFYDPVEHGEDLEGILPYKLDRDKPGIYAVEARTDPYLTIRSMEIWIKRHRDILTDLKKRFYSRKPALHIEATII